MCLLNKDYVSHEGTFAIASVAPRVRQGSLVYVSESDSNNGFPNHRDNHSTLSSETMDQRISYTLRSRALECEIFFDGGLERHLRT